jgi:hypothetical protein
MPEKTSAISYIQVQNRAQQNAVQAGNQPNFGNNLPLNPSVEDLNRITLVSRTTAGGGGCEPEASGTSTPMFGTHIREAVAIVRDWAK